MVEFALVLPILFVLFVAIADFGRIFAANIAVEAAARDAAEATANQYLANPPGSLDAPPVAADPSTYYGDLHAAAASVVCAELRSQLNTNYDPATKTCPDMPVVFACVHDSADTYCGIKASPGAGAVPSSCTQMSTPPSNSQSPGEPAARWVEVRVCYHFTPLISSSMVALGDFWLESTRTFVVPCYFRTGSATECG